MSKKDSLCKGRLSYYISEGIIVNNPLLNYYTSKYAFLCPPLYHISNPAMQGGSPLFAKASTSDADGKRYFARGFDSKDEFTRYKSLILNAPQLHLGLWPVDIVEFKEESSLVRLSVAHRYDNTGGDRDQGHKYKYALLFDHEEIPKLLSAHRWVSGIDSVGWRHERIRRMGISITECLQKLNKSHYAFYDMHFSRFFFFENDVIFIDNKVKSGTAFLDFSNLLYQIGDVCSPAKTEYPLEFADPLYFKGPKKKKQLDLNTQNHNLAAMLFYLFMTTYAYYNASIEDASDDSLKHHYTYLKHFLNTGEFVFSDKNNRKNKGRNSYAWLLWEKLPSELKELFKKALVEYPNADVNRSVPTVPTPDDWMNAFQNTNYFKELIELG